MKQEENSSSLLHTKSITAAQTIRIRPTLVLLPVSVMLIVSTKKPATSLPTVPQTRWHRAYTWRTATNTVITLHSMLIQERHRSLLTTLPRPRKMRTALMHFPSRLTVTRTAFLQSRENAAMFTRIPRFTQFSKQRLIMKSLILSALMMTQVKQATP